MNIIEAGSLDIDAINLRIGGIITSEDQKALEVGNKFVVVEHFVDPEGNNVDAEQFDHRSMCYSLFVSPEEVGSTESRHRYVLRHHMNCGKMGEIVGGGLLRVSSQCATLRGISTQFYTEPLLVRSALAKLLVPKLRAHLNNNGLEISVLVPDIDIAPYWLRFQQIFATLKDGLQSHDFARKLQEFTQG